MKRVRCSTCELAKQRPNYWNDRVGFVDSQARPVYSHGHEMYELGGRIYCGDCLIHAQLILTNLLGEASIYQMLNSEHNNRLKDFATPNANSTQRVFWRIDESRLITGKANV